MTGTYNTPVDKNKTVWQRIQAALEPTEGRTEAARLTGIIFPAVIAERADAATPGGTS